MGSGVRLYMFCTSCFFLKNEVAGSWQLIKGFSFALGLFEPPMFVIKGPSNQLALPTSFFQV